MKASHYTTPRTLADASFVQGYSTMPIKAPVSRSERLAGVFLAVVIGIALALLLVHGVSQ
jgi:ABC-type nitrate/sulfonate/bicarbonate transport system permease component